MGYTAGHGPRRSRLRGALVALTLLATACGSASGDGEEPASGAASVAPNNGTAQVTVTHGAVLVTAFTVSQRLGGEGAFTGIVVALDRGYSVAQVLDGSDDLGADGWISADGERVDPAGQSLGLVGPAPDVEEESVGSRQSGPMGLRAVAPQQSEEDEQYVAFIGETLGEMWLRIEGRVKWDLPGEQVDEYVDNAIEAARINAEFDALFAEDPDEFAELEESEAWAAAVMLMLMGHGYSLEDALEAALLGTFEGRGQCLVISGAVPATPIRMDGCKDVVDEAALDGDETSDESAAAGDTEQDASGDDGDGAGGGSAGASSDDVPTELAVTEYSIVPTGSPTGGGETIIGGTLSAAISGPELTLSGEVTWDDPVIGDNVNGVTCSQTDTYTFAATLPAVAQVLVGLPLESNTSSELKGDCGPAFGSPEAQAGRIADQLDGGQLALSFEIVDGVLVGGDLDGALSLAPAG